MKKTALFFRLVWVCALVGPFGARADEGMWLPLFLKQYNEAALRERGFKLTAEDIYSVNKSSLKDGVVLFGGGCTGEIISPEGLLLTNHHCGFGQIQSHSSVEKDYLKNGFWAMSRKEELPNPGLTASFLIRMEDVSQQVMRGISPNTPADQRETLIKAAYSKIAKAAVEGTHYKAYVRPFFYGAEHYLFVLEEFTDVRLVGAPPSAIGKFGGDTDNWMWPRHTGDFSIFRVYAGKDNKPAPYSADNVPLKPRHFFPISLKGVKPGDFTLVLGFPGRTQQYISSWAVDMAANQLNPKKVALRGKRLEIIGQGMSSSDAIRIQYAAKQASIANAWKKWMGETKGIAALGGVAKKQAEEAALATWIAADPSRQAQYGQVLGSLEKLHQALRPVALPTEYYREAVQGSEMLASVAQYVGYRKKMESKEAAQPGQADKNKEALEKGLAGLFKNYNEAVDRQLLAVCMQTYAQDIEPRWFPEAFVKEIEQVKGKYKGNWQAWADALYAKSRLANPQKSAELVADLAKGKWKALEKDPAYILWKGFAQVYEDQLVPEYLRLSQEIEDQHQKLMYARRGMEPNRAFYPDANSTFRVAYGQVNGYQPADGVQYQFRTTLDGVMQKEDPNNEEFVVPEKVKSLYQTKDFGDYGDQGVLPVAFIASNHTTGGNSGSPVLDAEGNLIGTNFDRVWEGTMSDLLYSPKRCRNIILDARYTLWVIDKYAGAGHLVKEMKLVR